MSGAARVRSAGVACGVAGALVAGAVLGGGWWAVAGVAAIGALTGRTGLLVQAVATLALVGGAAGDATWLVPLLVAGVVATAEGGAVTDRATVAGPPTERGAALAASLVAAAVAAGLLWLAELGPAGGVPAALVAAVAATAALAALTP